MLEKCIQRPKKKRSPCENDPRYLIWTDIKRRCTSPKCHAYKDYGGRGILMAEEFRTSFKAFCDHMGPRPSAKHSVDRIDNNAGYFPGNLRWATQREQCRNQRVNHKITYQGQTRCVVEWGEILGINPGTIYSRLYGGWTEEEALGTPRYFHPRKSTATKDDRAAQQRAMSAVHTAIRRGEIIKPKCCQYKGCTKTHIHGYHHHGHSPEKHLDVLWLCVRHHKKVRYLGVDENISLSEGKFSKQVLHRKNRRRGPSERQKLLVKASYAVARAIKNGKIIKPPKCMHPSCQTAKIRSYHYNGYAKENWFDVIWLCYSHHTLCQWRGIENVLPNWPKDYLDRSAI